MNADPTPNDPVGRQLVADAQSLSPAFSERLHLRTMRAVRAQRIRATLRQRQPGWGLPTAAAAAILLAAAAWWLTGHPIPTQRQLALQPPAIGVDLGVPDAGELLRHGSQPLQHVIGEIDNNSLAQLQHDARSFARFIANQLPTDPRRTPKTDQRL